MTTPTADTPGRRVSLVLILPWLWVAVPFAYGVWQLCTKITQLFSV
ncbi:MULTISPECIES: hypothetical protein [unclassified Mycobacterium]|nr:MULTISPECIES: hypothetical protein [unclassified Mycobacterium]